MKKALIGLVVLLVACSAYWTWALMGAARLARFAANDDVGAILQRTDLPSLRRSLGSQIVRAYLDQNPKLKNLGPLERGFAGGMGVSVADAMLREALTAENIAALLKSGRFGKASASGGQPLWSMPPLGDVFGNGLLTAVRSSYFDGPINFVVGLGEEERRYGVHLRLSGSTWFLSGLDIPREVADQLAREIAAKQDS
jgi:Protein of unknown function (DUF2939)